MNKPIKERYARCVYEEYLLFDDKVRIGPFSSHWAACAAMIRCSDPSFRSLGGDLESDLMIERNMRMITGRK